MDGSLMECRLSLEDGRCSTAEGSRKDGDGGWNWKGEKRGSQVKSRPGR